MKKIHLTLVEFTDDAGLGLYVNGKLRWEYENIMGMDPCLPDIVDDVVKTVVQLSPELDYKRVEGKKTESSNFPRLLKDVEL